MLLEEYPQHYLAGQGHEQGGAGVDRSQVSVLDAESQEAMVAQTPVQNARWVAAKGHPVQ